MPISWIAIALLLFVLWLLFLKLQNSFHEYSSIKRDRIAKAKKEAEKKSKPKEFKWPDNTPRF